MKKKFQKEELTQRFLQRGWENLTKRERRVIERVVDQAVITQTTNQPCFYAAKTTYDAAKPA